MSSLGIRQADTGYSNVYRNMYNIWDEDWFYRNGDEDTESIDLYNIFLEDFKDWLINHGVNVEEYPNMDFDAGYYFKEYMNDNPCPEIEQLYENVHDWLQGEEDFAASDEYLDSLWMLGSGGFDHEIVMGDIEDNARRLFKNGNDNHGFKTPDDLVEAVNKAIDDGHLDDVDQYDAGGMGYHAPVDGTEDYFETGSIFLGNGEEEWQMESPVPFSEEYDFGNCYRYFAIRGDCIYVTSDRMYIYGVPWQYVEEAGRELGLLGGSDNTVEPDNTVESDVIPF